MATRILRAATLAALVLSLPACCLAEAPSLIEVTEVELALSPASPSATHVQGVDPRGHRMIVFVDARHAELDLKLRASGKGGELLAADDNSGGGSNPWLKLQLDAPAELSIEVAAGPVEAAATVTLRVFALRQDAATAAAAELAGRRRAEAEAAMAGGDLGEASRILEAVVGGLLETPGGGECWSVAGELWRAGLAAYQTGALEVASKAMGAAVRFRERVLPPEHRHLLDAWSNHAAILELLGDGGGARELQEKVLAVALRTFPEDHETLVNARHNLALTLTKLGDLHRAKSLFEQVLPAYLRTLSDDHQNVQLARYNYANCLLALGDYAGARELHAKVLAVSEQTLPDDHVELQFARLAYAQAATLMGDDRGAQELREKALAVFERSLPPDHPYVQDARLGCASSLHAQGDYAGARARFEQALEVFERTLPADHPNLVTVRQNYARTLEAQGDARAALAQSELALAALERSLPDTHPNLLEARNSLAASLATLGERGERLHLLLGQLTAAIVSQQVALRPQLSHRQAAAVATQAGKLVSSTLSMALLLDEGACAELETAAFAAIETIRCAESAAHRLARLAPPAGSESASRAAELRREITVASHAVAELAADPARHEELRETIRRKEAAESALVALLAQEPEARPLLEPTTAAAVARALAPGEAAVGYWEHIDWQFPAADAEPRVASGQPFVSALVVRADGSVTRLRIGDAEAVLLGVKAWRAQVRDGKTLADPTLAATAAALRRRLLDPVMEAAGDITRLHVAADGALHLVPLDALPLAAAPQGAPPPADGGADELVGDRVEVRVVTALRDLLLAGAEPPVAPPSLLALGAIDYEAPAPPGAGAALAAAVDELPAEVYRDRSFVPLPATAGEVRAAARSFAASHAQRAQPAVLEGRAATREALLERVRGTRFLHLATHAWFAPDDVPFAADAGADATRSARPGATTDETVRGFAPMLLCGLALAGAGAKAEGAPPAGILTAQEIAALDLSGCELAVLSACETSLGSRRPGQGVASLQQALHAGGVRLSLTSLWKVPDQATRLLMDEFYRRLWELGEPPHQALWMAKRKLREATDPAGKPLHPPRDWAGWTLCGVPPP